MHSTIKFIVSANPSREQWSLVEEGVNAFGLESMAPVTPYPVGTYLYIGNIPIGGCNLYQCAMGGPSISKKRLWREFASGQAARQRYRDFQPSPNCFLKLASTRPAGMNRRNVLNNDA